MIELSFETIYWTGQFEVINLNKSNWQAALYFNNNKLKCIFEGREFVTREVFWGEVFTMVSYHYPV